MSALRERSWLARWLKEPDRMLAEKDPIATGLYAKYNRLAMPNMRINNGEVNELRSFLDGFVFTLCAHPLACFS